MYLSLLSPPACANPVPGLLRCPTPFLTRHVELPVRQPSDLHPSAAACHYLGGLKHIRTPGTSPAVGDEVQPVQAKSVCSSKLQQTSAIVAMSCCYEDPMGRGLHVAEVQGKVTMLHVDQERCTVSGTAVGARLSQTWSAPDKNRSRSPDSHVH